MDYFQLFFCLHQLDEEGRALCVRTAKKQAKRLEIHEWVQAERNLALPATCLVHLFMRVFKPAQYRAYKEFLRQGGLEGFIHRLQLSGESFCVESRRIFWGGSAACVVLKWQKPE